MSTQVTARNAKYWNESALIFFNNTQIVIIVPIGIMIQPITEIGTTVKSIIPRK
jgi:hypothetical protein